MRVVQPQEIHLARQEMEKMQAKGEIDEEELKAMEMDVTGKVGARSYHHSVKAAQSVVQIMLASWRGARLEVVQVLREVLDQVLKEPGAKDEVLLNRAKVGCTVLVL